MLLQVPFVVEGPWTEITLQRGRLVFLHVQSQGGLFQELCLALGALVSPFVKVVFLVLAQLPPRREILLAIVQVALEWLGWVVGLHVHQHVAALAECLVACCKFTFVWALTGLTRRTNTINFFSHITLLLYLHDCTCEF